MQLHAADSVEAPHAEGAISGTGDPEGSESEDDSFGDLSSFTRRNVFSELLGSFVLQNYRLGIAASYKLWCHDYVR